MTEKIKPINKGWIWRTGVTFGIIGSLAYGVIEHNQRVQTDSGLNQQLQGQAQTLDAATERLDTVEAQQAQQAERLDTVEAQKADVTIFEEVQCFTLGEVLKVELFLKGEQIPQGPVDLETCRDISTDIHKIYNGPGRIVPTPAPGTSQGN